MSSYINTSLNSKIHIPVYAGLLTVNVTLFLRIASKLMSSILCDV